MGVLLIAAVLVAALAIVTLPLRWPDPPVYACRPTAQVLVCQPVEAR